MPDIFKILKDLELKSVGLDPETNKMQEGYFVSFRSVGLPIHEADFSNPWSPLGVNLEKAIPVPPPASPGQAPKTGSSQLDDTRAFTAAIARSQQSYLNGFMLTDAKLQMNNQYAVMPGSSRVSDSWYAIITGANGIPTDSVLSPAMQKAYDRARSKLMDAEEYPTRKYQAYLQYEDAYKEKLRVWRKAYAAAFTDPMKLQNWPIEGTSYHDDVDAAMDRWNGFGFKQEIESALATLAAQGTDPAIALIARCKKRFINSLNEFQGIGQIPYTLMLPNSWWERDNDDGWYDYTSTDFHNESHYESASTSFGGGGGYNVGLWSAGASFNHANDRASVSSSSENLEIAFKYCVVDIVRPWLDTSLLNLKNWFLMGDYKKGTISNGTMDQHVPDDGVEPTFLPSIVTSLILIKDLSIKWDNWKSEWDSRSNSTSASASFGYGPFAVNGHFSHRGQENDFESDETGESLKVQGIQLIGYVSTINPTAPGVDSSDYLEPAGADSAAGEG